MWKWYTIREAADILGITEAALRMRITRQSKRGPRKDDIKTMLDIDARPPARYVQLSDATVSRREKIRENQRDLIDEVIATAQRLYPHSFSPPKGMINRVKAAWQILTG